MKLRLFLRIVLVLLSTGIFSIQRSTAQDNKVYTAPTVMPTYISGKNGLATFLKANVKYPAAADSAKVKGSVAVSFIVEKSGGLTGINVTKGIGHGCDEEALRVVRKMPKWNPGTVANKPVRVSYTLWIRFPQ